MGNFSEEVEALDEAWSRLNTAAEQLYPEELTVLAEVAESLLRGQTSYSPLDLAKDGRDFARESWDEDRDYLAYRAMQIVRGRLRDKKKGNK